MREVGGPVRIASWAEVYAHDKDNVPGADALRSGPFDAGSSPATSEHADVEPCEFAFRTLGAR